MNDVFFVADHHFSHSNIIIYCDRPWLRPGDLDENRRWISKDIAAERAEEMDEAMVENWNAKVSKGDTVYVVGDFMFAKETSAVETMLERLHGQKHLVIGSHDRKTTLQAKGWAHQAHKIKRRFENRLIVMNHNPEFSWDSKIHGAWMVHGHVHGNLQNSFEFKDVPWEYLLICDVGVDCPHVSFAPMAYEELKAYMDKKEPHPLAKKDKR